jgi:small subunit ribosomal protein S6
LSLRDEPGVKSPRQEVKMAIQPKFYETLYLVRPDINPDDLATIQEKVTKAINSGEGEISRDEKWAERDLTYPINDYTRGTYYIVDFKALPSVIANIEKHLAFHNVDVLRFMTVNVEEPSAKVADAPPPAAPKAPSKERTPARSTPPSAPAASPKADNTPKEATLEAPSAPVSAPVEEKTPEAPSAPESTPVEEKTPEAPSAPESAPVEEKTPEAPSAPESTPVEEKTPEAPSTPEDDTSATSSSSGFTAAPPLSTEDKESGGEN